MSTFDGYSTGNELHRSGTGSVFAARKEGDAGAPAFIVRTCRPDASIIGEDAARRSVELFAQSAEALKTISSNATCAPRFAKVHAQGAIQPEQSDDGMQADDGMQVAGAFLVSDLATRGTIEKIATGKIQLDSPTLSFVIGEVVQALRDLNSAFSRGHGNLKPSNVLLVGAQTEELSACKVLLTDPLPMSRADAKKDALADLRAIGELIHLLVLHTKFRGGWPVESAAAWTALGRDGAKWRELINTLLDPNDKAPRPSLDELATIVAGLKTVRKSKLPMYVGGGVGLAIIIGVVLMVALGGRGKKLDFKDWNAQTSQRWTDLCKAYSGWYSEFQNGLDADLVKKPSLEFAGTEFKTRREAYKALDPQLRALLDAPGVAQGFDVWSIAEKQKERESVDPMSLAARPPDVARSVEGVAKTAQAIIAVEALKRGLSEGWEAPKSLLNKAGEYKARSWTKPAAFLEAVASGANPETSSNFRASIDAVLGAAALVAKIDASWTRIQELQPELDKLNDPILAKFAPASAQLIASGFAPGTGGTRDDLVNLEKQAAKVAEVGDKLAKFAKEQWPTIDIESFNSGAKFASMKDAPMSIEVASDWLAEVVKHPQVDPALDPRRGFDPGAILTSIEEKATQLTGPKLKGVMDDAVKTRITSAKSEAQSISPSTLRWTRKNQPTVETKTQALKGELAALNTALDTMIERRRTELSATASEVRRTLAAKNDVIPGIDVVNTRWRTWRDRLSGAYPDEQYADLLLAANALEDALRTSSSGAMPAPLAKSGADVPASDWSMALADASVSERDARLDAALKTLGDQPPDPKVVKDAITRAGAGFGEFVSKLTAMRTELAKAEKDLDEGAGVPGDDGPLEAALSKWSKDPDVQQRAIQDAILGLKGRADATRALRGEKDANVLLAKILTPDPARPELALASWKRLGDADISWPASPADAAKVRQVRQALGEVIKRVPETRRQPLAKQVSSDLASRWTKWAQSARDLASFEAAVGVMGDFDVVEASLPPVLKYNLRVRALKSEAANAKLSDDATVALIKKFQSDVQGLGAPVASLPAPRALLAGAAPIASGDEPPAPKIDVTTLGPGSVNHGWVANLDGNSGDLTFTRGSTRLEFARVDFVANGQPDAVFVATRELSIGELSEIVDAANGWSELQKATPLDAAEAPAGPRGWTYDARGKFIPGRWLKSDALFSDQTPALAPGIGGPVMVTGPGGEPTSEHPVQSLSPISLGLVARFAGCRFLSPEEWSQTKAKFAATEAGANLRDATFDKQRAHIVSMKAKGGRAAAFTFPDDGVFYPPSATSPKGESAAARPGDDGVLFFTKTSQGPGNKVKNLIGNVAELLDADPVGFERLSPTTDSVEKFLGASQVFVIGGSALSPPDVPTDRALPLGILADSVDGFADVGVRLAFSASGSAPPKPSFVSRLNALLTDKAFILPAAP